MPYYRIVRDNFLGYEVQSWRWWFPFWIQGHTNTHSNVQDAEAYARSHTQRKLARIEKKRWVKNLGKL